jgi:spermidine synthase
MIGGCAYTYPRDFLKNFPEASIDVVEIDSGMTQVAKKYFGLVDDVRMNIFHEDGRTFLNNNQKKYDVIFNDAFNSFFVPFQLATIEAVEKNFSALNEDGIIIVNLISKSGDEGKFFQAEYNTYKKVFPQVYVFALDDFSNTGSNQNIILIATKSKESINFSGIEADPQLKKYAEKLWSKPIQSDIPILTDDFAPVEHYQRELF